MAKNIASNRRYSSSHNNI